MIFGGFLFSVARAGLEFAATPPPIKSVLVPSFVQAEMLLRCKERTRRSPENAYAV